METKMKVLGKEVTVKDRVPYEAKLNAAEDYVAAASVFNEDTGVAYMTNMEEAVRVYNILKLYTDADLSEYEGLEGLYALMDKVDYETYDAITKYAKRDIWIFEDMVATLFDNAKTVFEKEMSLESKIKTSFGFLLDGKDLTETMAHAREINEQMIDTLGAMRNNNKPIDIS